MLPPAAHIVDQCTAQPSGEFGLVFLEGPAHLKTVTGTLAEAGDTVPASVRYIARRFLEQIELLTNKIDDLTRRLRDTSRASAEMRRLCGVPGVGPVTAGAIMAFAPDLRTFSSDRNFAAWLGLVPRQRSTGGKTRLGGVCKMGQSDVRKLLIVGAMSRIRWIVRKEGVPRHLARARRWAQASHGRGSRLGEQDGTDHLGYDDEGAELQDGVICGSL